MLDHVDNLLRILAGQRGQELRLEVGEPARMFTDAGMFEMTPNPLSKQDLGTAITPVLTDTVRRLIPVQPRVEFDYDCVGVGPFRGLIVRNGSDLSVSFRPAKAIPAAPPRPAAPPQGAPPPRTETAPLPYSGKSVPPVATPPPSATRTTPAIERLFRAMCAAGASDLHLSVSVPPMIRKDGQMTPLEEGAPLTADAIETLLWEIMPEKNREEFTRRHDTDFAYEVLDLARFRVNVFLDRKGMGAVFRVIPNKILTAEDLGLSQHILKLCQLQKGLVLVTGPTGSGKSTTLCALIDYVNRTRSDHIITIEDPIEFVHENRKCLINQREVHNHTDSFKSALRAALREDPDILLVGEMRDLETISIAIETAETGHLVFGTLHTTTAASTVDRIIDQFPTDRQSQIRVMLSESLRGVIAQTLLKKKGGGRVAALEVLVVNPAISNLIREGKTFQIPSMMQTGRGLGMMSLNDSLLDLVKRDLVAPEEAYSKAVDKNGFEQLLKRANISTSVAAAAAE
jgi:twitching motility protein PilT